MTDIAATGGAGALVDAGPSHRDRKKQRAWQAIHDAAFRLVLTRGAADVTVEQICSDADVSPRTFFNYFPTKHDAALGLNTISVCAADEAVQGGRDVVDDVCTVLAMTVTRIPNRARKRVLLFRRPELRNAVMLWIATLSADLTTVAERSTDPSTARTAVIVVLAALVESSHQKLPDSSDPAVTKQQLVRAVAALHATSAPTDSSN